MMSLSVLTARATRRRLDRLELRLRPGTRPRAPSAAFLFTRAVCGTCASSTASAACGVPGTEASTRERGCSSGIFLKSAGSVGVANVHGPVKSGAENQRPATRK